MTGRAAREPLTGDQRAALWAAHDRLRRQIEELQVKFSQVNDRLMDDLNARTGFPRGSGEAMAEANGADL